MSSALTFLFKNIFPSFEEFKEFLTNEKIVDLTNVENLTFAEFMFKILFRRFHNSNIQYDTIDDFKCDFANILEDYFARYKKQVDLIKKIEQLTEEDILRISTALANQSNNPNSKPTDPTQPLEFVSAQAFTIARDNKLQAYLRALQNIPTLFIEEMLKKCVNLFKTIIPKVVYVFEDKEIKLWK